MISVDLEAQPASAVAIVNTSANGLWCVPLPGVAKAYHGEWWWEGGRWSNLELLRGFLDCLARVDCLDGADDLGLVGRAINVPGEWLGRFGFLRHAGSIGPKLCAFNKARFLRFYVRSRQLSCRALRSVKMTRSARGRNAVINQSISDHWG